MRVRFEPRNGMLVEVRGIATFYEPQGARRLSSRTSRGRVGLLWKKFQELRERLEKEGLFEPCAERPLPPLPSRVGVSPLKAARPFATF